MRTRGSLAAALLAVLLGGCNEENTLLPVAWIDSGPLTATALDMHNVQLRWARVEGGRTYNIERRANLTGDFATIASLRNETATLDADLEPGTTYGYRLRVENDLGQVVATSTVTAARTPPVPGVEVVASSELGAYPGQAVDSTGYRVRITGANTDRALPVEARDTALFEPLAPGTYSVAIDDIASQCQITTGGSSRNVTVTDQGLLTRARVTFELRCRARDRGRLSVQMTVDGDTTDADGLRLVLSGAADDTTLPPSERAVVITRQVSATSATAVFDDVRPGTYSLLLDDVSPLCTVAGTRQRDGITLTALGSVTQSYAVTCSRPSTGNRPFVFRTAWSRDTAAVGAVVSAAVSLDLRAHPGLDVTAVQFVVRTPSGASIVRADSVVLAAGWTGVSNLTTPGQFQVVATNLGSPTGLVQLLTAYYTVIGVNGDKARTQAQIANLASGAGSEFQDSVRAVEDTLVVGAGGSSGGGGGGGGGGGAQTTPFTWSLHFGAFDAGTQTVPLDIALDLSSNVAETPGVEQLQDWVVDSLKWNKDILQFNSFTRASGTSTVNFIEALSRGVLRLRGTVAASQSTGVIPIGTVRFALTGNPGQQSAVASYLGSLLGTAATGSYEYKPRVIVQDATYTIPAAGPPATAYPFTVTWSPVTAGQATMTVRLDMGALNDPANHGAAADKIGAFQGTFTFPASRLSGASCAGQSGFSGVFNTQTVGVVTTVITNLSGASGNVTLFLCTFAVSGAGPTSVAVSGLLASDELGVADFTSKLDVVVSPLP